jgi:hypothetical protein
LKTYRAYGLNIQSEIPLPELPCILEEPEVCIREGKIEEAWNRTKRVRDFIKTSDGVLLSWRRLGRFLIRDGSEVLVELVPGADKMLVRHLILGPVLGVLNFQRGIMFFHASAVALPTGGVAFMASKGHGKSTQAAAFVRRGHALITDDLLLLKEGQNRIWAVPGVPFIKLWPKTLALMGEDPCDHSWLNIIQRKQTLNKEDFFVKNTVAMQAVYLLEDGPQVEIKRLSSKDALIQLMPHWYGALFQGELLSILGLERHFRDCTAIVKNLPVYRLRRPISFDFLPAICEAIECSV